jgi:error-prone DNA polymerase
MPYAELHCISNFTFLRGASHPEELVTQAHALGYTALAITDECSLAGVVRAHEEAKRGKLKLIIGAEFRLDDGLAFVLLATNRAGYGNLSALITKARRRATKGSYRLLRDDVRNAVADCLALWLPGAIPNIGDALFLSRCFPGQCWLAVELLAAGDDAGRLTQLEALASKAGLPLVAAGDVHMHVRGRRALQDTVTAIRLKKPVSECGQVLHPNGERHLRPVKTLAQLYPDALLAEAVSIAERCHFSLDELRYEYPEEIVPSDETAASYLRRLTEEGLLRRFPDSHPHAVAARTKCRGLIEHELELIAEKRYEAFFLTVYDIVRFARSQNILCQGRGSAANSTVCYCLGITEVDPSLTEVLFERFVSRERDEPPDIDVDFEHQRREEVMQYIYKKYGRDRTALAATVIRYRSRSAIRDVGKALGLEASQVDRLAKSLAWWDDGQVAEERIREAGLDPASPVVKRLIALVATLLGFPRHLSQHVGGFVISRGPLSQLVPIENAAMVDRSNIQWDKDDLDALGLLKVDVLALGMLSCIRRALELVSLKRGWTMTMQDIPKEDPVTYDMICKADTIGVFQIESRAQMAMLPRLRPRKYYDLVIEVAIVRPGPIQGGMVHPYLRRRQGLEKVTYPRKEVEEVLSRTLGVPIFQEQVMQLAVKAAGFSHGEADQLRRSMAAWKRKGGLGPYKAKIIEGMRERGYDEEFAQRVFKQIEGFGEYGFPESHAASFALLVYISSWLKCHEPAAFTCALINSQPMGFYSPSQLVQDAQRHNVEVRPVDVNASRWECTLEGEDLSGVRLGFCLVKDLSEQAAERIVAARIQAPFAGVADLARRTGIGSHDLNALAAANALQELSGHRRDALWDVTGVERLPPLLDATDINETAPCLAAPSEGENIVADYQSLGLTLGRHPLALLRNRLDRQRVAKADSLRDFAHGSPVRVTGLVTGRQRPGSAKGVIFVTLEDESGNVNVVVWPDLAEIQRRELLGASLLTVYGIVQREGEVIHVVAHRLRDQSPLLGGLLVGSRDFR